MSGALSVPSSDGKKVSRIDYPDPDSSEIGSLKRSAYTFTSQQEYEDKIEKVTYGQFASVSAFGSTLFRPRTKGRDEEAQAGARETSTTRGRSNESDADDGASTRASSKPPTRVPTLRLTPDDDATSTLIDLGSDLNDHDEKQNYDFLNQDGRWHSKPHVYEYNKASSRLLQTAQPHLFGRILQKDRSGPKKCVLNVATMQAIVLRTYQNEIAEAGKEMLDGKMSVMLPQLIHKYCEALRDMDYIQEKAGNRFDGDPFLLMTSKQAERELMESHQLIPRGYSGLLTSSLRRISSHPSWAWSDRPHTQAAAAEQIPQAV